MRLAVCVLLASLVLTASAQSVTLTGSNPDTTQPATSTGADYATSGVTYADDSSTLTITTTSDYATVSSVANGTASSNTGNSNSTSSPTQTLLVGSSRTTMSLNGTASGNSSATRTSSSARPTNTAPCNGYPEFCQRKFSNITHVAAHNSPFVRPGSLAANQMLDVRTQLNDGIRMRAFPRLDFLRSVTHPLQCNSRPTL